MKDYTRDLLEKAIDTIEGAELLLDHGKIDLAAGRAYTDTLTQARESLGGRAGRSPEDIETKVKCLS